MADVLQLLPKLRSETADIEGLALLRHILIESELANRTALVTSFGAESSVLLDMMATVDRDLPILFLDTGKHFDETLAYAKTMRSLLRLSDVRMLRPDPVDLRRIDPAGDLFRRDPDRCCEIRKTLPLQQALEPFNAWITGRKRFHGGGREMLSALEPEGQAERIKINPLVGWTPEDIERYRILRDLPAHPLAERGYSSIGCEVCTRPVKPGEPLRSGRWWDIDKTECGIHRLN